MADTQDIFGSLLKGAASGASAYADAKMANSQSDVKDRERRAKEEERERKEFERELKFAETLSRAVPENDALTAYHGLLKELGYVPNSEQKRVFLEAHETRKKTLDKQMEDAKLALLYDEPSEKIPSSVGGESFAGIDFGQFAEAEGVGPNPTPTQAGSLLPYYQALSGGQSRIMRAVGETHVPPQAAQTIIADVQKQKQQTEQTEAMRKRQLEVGAQEALPSAAELRSQKNETRSIGKLTRDIRDDYRTQLKEWKKAKAEFNVGGGPDPGDEPRLDQIFYRDYRPTLDPEEVATISKQLGLTYRSDIPPTWKGTPKQWEDYKTQKGLK